MGSAEPKLSGITVAITDIRAGARTKSLHNELKTQPHHRTMLPLPFRLPPSTLAPPLQLPSSEVSEQAEQHWKCNKLLWDIVRTQQSLRSRWAWWEGDHGVVGGPGVMIDRVYVPQAHSSCSGGTLEGDCNSDYCEVNQLVFNRTDLCLTENVYLDLFNVAAWKPITCPWNTTTVTKEGLQN